MLLNHTFSQETSKAVVISFDEGWVEAGFAGEESPSLVFPAVVSDSGVGEDAGEGTYPIGEGKILNWQNFEALLNHVYESLQVSPKDHPVLISTLIGSTEEETNQLKQLMFETFEVPAFCTMSRSVLALYASGRTRGLVLDLGWERSCAVPIYEGYDLPHAIISVSVGERDLIDYMNKVLTERGEESVASAEVRDMLEKVCYIGEDFDYELAKAAASSELAQNFELSNGKTLTLEAERVRVPECLFKPNMLGIEEEGIHRAVYESIMKVDLDLRRDLYTNIVITGCNSMLHGLTRRLEKEITYLAPPSFKIKVLEGSERKFSSWIGGSITADLSNFPNLCTTKQQYEESTGKKIESKHSENEENSENETSENEENAENENSENEENSESESE